MTSVTGTSATDKLAINTTKSNTLDQTTFLKLMTTQLKTQDPFNPVDNTQMVAQMAQISTTSGISEMNTTMKAIADKLGVTSTGEALGYVGKTVLTPGSTAYGRAAGGIAGSVELAGAATDVNVTISDANGAVLKTMSLGRQAKGTIGYDWDGKDAAGAETGNGPFTVQVNAQNAGTTVGATGLVWSPVQSVSTTTGAAILTLPGLGEIPASAVRQIG